MKAYKVTIPSRTQPGLGAIVFSPSKEAARKAIYQQAVHYAESLKEFDPNGRYQGLTLAEVKAERCPKYDTKGTGRYVTIYRFVFGAQDVVEPVPPTSKPKKKTVRRFIKPSASMLWLKALNDLLDPGAHADVPADDLPLVELTVRQHNELARRALAHQYPGIAFRVAAGRYGSTVYYPASFAPPRHQHKEWTEAQEKKFFEVYDFISKYLDGSLSNGFDGTCRAPYRVMHNPFTGKLCRLQFAYQSFGLTDAPKDWQPQLKDLA